ncbi:MAG: SoxR reducing system RseC family protein [Desulfuromonas sp.]|nr:SoxR reducing system RseC family protein [Desulfuromonas sp.]
MTVNQIKEYAKQLFKQQGTITEEGEVVELRAKRVAIVNCEGGASCSGCGASGGCCSGGAGKKRLFADNIPYARVGDRVLVQVETTAGIADSQTFLYVIAFIMLAIGLGVGYFIASFLPVGMPAALLSLLIGCVFMVGALGVLRFARPAVVQSSFAKIIEIVSTTEHD